MQCWIGHIGCTAYKGEQAEKGKVLEYQTPHRTFSCLIYPGIAGGFVLQLLKSSSIQYRSSLAERNGPGGS
jgi:hypothetical protein